MEIQHSLIFILFSLFAPVLTFGGGILVSNALTLTGVDLVTAAGMTIVYFFLNGMVVLAFFRKHIIWSEVKMMLPLATVGSILGGLFLSYISPLVLLVFMLFFSVKFLYEFVAKKKVNEEKKISVWTLALLSGFLASAALPGGGLRNNYMLSKGYSLSEMYGTTQMIGSIGWVTSIIILLHQNVISWSLVLPIVVLTPVLVVINLILQKSLVNIPGVWSKRISFVSILAFVMYGCFFLVNMF